MISFPCTSAGKSRVVRVVCVRAGLQITQGSAAGPFSLRPVTTRPAPAYQMRDGNDGVTSPPLIMMPTHVTRRPPINSDADSLLGARDRLIGAIWRAESIYDQWSHDWKRDCIYSYWIFRDKFALALILHCNKCLSNRQKFKVHINQKKMKLSLENFIWSMMENSLQIGERDESQGR
jgi:hypothetical protein